MNFFRPSTVALLGLVAAAGILPGCGGDDHGHDHADGDHEHDHAGDGKPASGDAHAHDHEHDHANLVALGESPAGRHVVTLALDGTVKAGAETGFDVAVKSADGAPRVAAIRVWIGTEDGAGSLRAKAEVEGTGWHAHVEAPDPVPAGSRVWVEIEEDGGARVRTSFPTEPGR
jgi:hypothetical protein